METENSRPHNPAPRPHRPGMTPQPVGRRPVMDGFMTRRPGAPSPAPANRVAQPVPVTSRPVAHAPRPQAPQPVQTHPASNDFVPRPTAAAPRSQTPDPLQREFVPEVEDELDTPKGAKPPKEHSRTGHSGLVGFIVFVVLGALLISPFVPGKIMQDFPLSSSNFSTGDQALDCLQNQGTVSSTTSYDTKAGSPLTYRYSTSTTQSATCEGTAQTAVVGHTSQFSPLALLIDVAVALAVAVVVAKVWRKLFGEKRSKR